MKLFCSTLLLFIAVQLAAQVQLTGIVSDEEKLPLEMANVFIVNPATKSVVAFGSTDSQGRYKLNLKPNISYILKASYVGMETFEQNIQIKEENLNIPISLKTSNILDEVSIVRKMPVSVKGDTLVYNTDAFTSGTERKLEDVLKKLPGVEVESNGEIKVQGKKVKKVMVEGKDFFGGNSKLATKNIPADAVDKVEVLKNHSEIDQLSPVMDNDDNLAMNIKLKEGKKRFWFGEITAGGGTDKHYISHPKLFYYSPKYSLNFIGDLNNIGEQPLTWSDYFKFTGNFPKNSKSTNINLNSGLSALLMPNDKVKNTRSQFGAGNFSYSPTEKWTLSGFAIYSKNKIAQEILQETTHLQTTANTQINENSTEKNTLESQATLFKFKSQYKADENHQLNYHILANFNKKEQESWLNSSVLHHTEEQDDKDNFSLQQSLNYYLTLNEKHIFSFNFQHFWQKENPLYQALVEQFSFADLLHFQPQNNTFNLQQSQKLRSHKADFNTEYFYVLSPKSNLNFSLCYVWNEQKFNSQLFAKTANSPQFANDVNYQVQDAYAGLHYRFILGKFVFNSGATLHRYSAENKQNSGNFKNNSYRLLPDFSANFKLNATQNFRLTYAMQNEFTSVKKLAKNYVLYNYRNLFSGTSELKKATYHNLQLSYRNFSSFHFTSMYFSLRYQRKIDEVKSQTKVENLQRITTPYNSYLADENLNFFGNFQKTFRSFKWSIGSNFSYSTSNSLLQTQNSKYTSFAQNYNTKLSSNLDFPLNFDLGYTFNHNRYKQNSLTQNYLTHSPSVSLELVFLHDFIFQSKYTYNLYRKDSQRLNEYNFWNASLRYQPKDSKWEFELSAKNLLNNKTLNSNFANEFLINTSSYLIQPHFALLQIRYKL